MHPLRTWRKDRGITLQGLAALIGVTQSHLSEIENWKNEPSLDLAARLSLESGIEIAKFVKSKTLEREAIQ